MRRATNMTEALMHEAFTSGLRVLLKVHMEAVPMCGMFALVCLCS